MSEENFIEVAEKVKNALAGAGSATGGTMLPVETANEIIEIVYERNFMRGLFPSMPMSRKTLNVPSLDSSIAFHGHSLADTDAGTSASESRPSTGEIVLEMKTMIANIPVGNYLIAYGVEGLLSVIRDDIASRLAFNETSLFINGDTETGGTYANNINGAYKVDAPNLNLSGVNADNNDYLLLMDGLRKKAGKSVSVSGSFTLAHLRSAISQLGVYAENRSDLALIVPREVEVVLLGLSDLQTVDKYGPAATILSGEVGKIYGVRVFATSAIPTNLNWTGNFAVTASGVVQDKTVCLLLHTRSPMIGNSTIADRRFSIDFHDEPAKDRFLLIPRQDVAFGVRYVDAICKMHGVSTS